MRCCSWKAMYTSITIPNLLIYLFNSYTFWDTVAENFDVVTILSRYPLENIFNPDEFGLFYQCLPKKNCIWIEKSAHEESTVTSVSQDWLLVMRMMRGSRCLSLERLINQDVLKALGIYRAVIALNARVGSQRNFSKNGWGSWIKSLGQLIERSPWPLIIVRLIHM